MVTWEGKCHHPKCSPLPSSLGFICRAWHHKVWNINLVSCVPSQLLVHSPPSHCRPVWQAEKPLITLKSLKHQYIIKIIFISNLKHSATALHQLPERKLSLPKPGQLLWLPLHGVQSDNLVCTGWQLPFPCNHSNSVFQHQQLTDLLC